MQTTIVATVTKDSELAYSKAGTAFLRIPCAVNYNTRNDGGMWETTHTDFLTVTVWKNAELLAESLLKGTRFIATVELTTQKISDGNGVYLNAKARDIGIIPKKPQTATQSAIAAYSSVAWDNEQVSPPEPDVTNPTNPNWDTNYSSEPPF